MTTIAERLRVIVAALPSGAAVTLPADALREWLADEPTSPAPVVITDTATSWCEKLWTVNPDTRVDVRQLAEALNRPTSFVYRHTSEKAAGAERIPHRRLSGELVFVVGELRTWIREHEETIATGRTDRGVTLVSRKAS